MIRAVTSLGVLTALVFAPSAHATVLTRTFVASTGVDTNPCTISQPCATFAHAYTLTAANGIIAALDPGKYGALAISQAITINGNGWAAITAPAQGNAITINAGASDNVILNGLEIDGAGTPSNGVVFYSGGSLTVTNCTVENFFYDMNSLSLTGDGIVMAPTSGTIAFTITNVTAANNGYSGINYFPSGTVSAKGVIEHVIANGNGDGIDILTYPTTGGTTVVTVADSIASSNNGAGIFIDDLGSGGTTTVSLDKVTAGGNRTSGVGAIGTAHVLLGRSVLIGNFAGIANDTSANTFYSYGDNRIDLNTSTDGTLSRAFSPQ